MSLPVGTIIERHQTDSGHKVTSAESVLGFVYVFKKTGTTQQIQIEDLNGYNETTGSKLVSLGYRCLSGHDHYLEQEAQGSDVDAHVVQKTRPIIRAEKLFIRVEDPALNDIIHLVFSARVVSKK